MEHIKRQQTDTAYETYILIYMEAYKSNTILSFEMPEDFCEIKMDFYMELQHDLYKSVPCTIFIFKQTEEQIQWCNFRLNSTVADGDSVS